MVKYIVEDGFSKIKKTGIGQYTLMLEKILSNLKIETVEIKKTKLEKIKNKVLRRICYNIWLNTFFLLKLLLIRDKVVVFFTNFAVPIFKLPNVKYIPVIHDLTPIKYPECTSKGINIYEKNNIYNAIKNNDYIITVSNTVKNEIIETFKVSPEKVCVVYNTIPQIFIDNNTTDNSILKKYGLEPKKYILSVATLNKRKNIPLLIEAFEQIPDKYPDIKVVLVGKMDNDKQLLLTKNPNIIFTGYVNDEEIPILYKNALLYVFPSEYEGFGIPIIESQYSQVPILCSDIEVFREVAGNGAEYCELNSNEIAEKVEYLINTPERMYELTKNGSQNVQKFAIDKISKQLQEVLQNIE